MHHELQNILAGCKESLYPKFLPWPS